MPTASETAIRELLQQIDGSIVDGPGALGVYHVKIEDAEDDPAAAAAQLLALVRDDQGFVEIKSLRPDVALIRRARVTGRVNCGKPILDPNTREVMGYEIAPIILPAA